MRDFKKCWVSKIVSITQCLEQKKALQSKSSACTEKWFAFALYKFWQFPECRRSIKTARLTTLQSPMQATAATASEVEAAVAYEKKVSSPNLTKRIEKDRKGTKWDKCSSRRLASEPLSFSIRTRLYSTLFCTHRHCRVPHLHQSMQPSWPPFSF